MSKQLLIYEKAVPVSSERHLNWSVKAGEDYEFARHVNAVPVTAVEIPTAASEYAIVFAGDDAAMMPVAVMGVRQQENLFLDESGDWQSKYVPAFLRRYPFVFSSVDEGDSLTLCIDEDFAGCNEDGRGERLFDSEGARTQYLEGVLEFLKQYQGQFQRTQLFCKKLIELELLEPMHAQITLEDGKRMDLTGFQAVNRAKLKALEPEKLAELTATDELEMIFVHLQSMRNFALIGEMVKDGDSDNGVEDSAS
jgi:hypothetical protein